MKSGEVNSYALPPNISHSSSALISMSASPKAASWGNITYTNRGEGNQMPAYTLVSSLRLRRVVPAVTFPTTVGPNRRKWWVRSASNEIYGGRAIFAELGRNLINKYQRNPALLFVF